ncbi:hypothetical protein [Photobacterium leiognathi]|uniref:hypothetical protein n=1 Tax=Photobacterium leiognathi TaxID=553611 RepID=UPI002980B7C1|nr:hypothetical protein [Photobacterium leiognathi]
MKKIALVVILTSASVSAHAYDSNKMRTEWQINPQNVPSIISTKNSFIARVDGRFVSIANAGINCSPGDIFGERVWVVDNQPIKFVGACFEGMPTFAAQSSAGQEFIYNEFATKNSVSIGDLRFSAKGFLSALKQSEINKKMAI